MFSKSSRGNDTVFVLWDVAASNCVSSKFSGTEWTALALTASGGQLRTCLGHPTSSECNVQGRKLLYYHYILNLQLRFQWAMGSSHITRIHKEPFLDVAICLSDDSNWLNLTYSSCCVEVFASGPQSCQQAHHQVLAECAVCEGLVINDPMNPSSSNFAVCNMFVFALCFKLTELGTWRKWRLNHNDHSMYLKVYGNLWHAFGLALRFHSGIFSSKVWDHDLDQPVAVGQCSI